MRRGWEGWVGGGRTGHRMEWEKTKSDICRPKTIYKKVDMGLLFATRYNAVGHQGPTSRQHSPTTWYERPMDRVQAPVRAIEEAPRNCTGLRKVPVAA